ncbi:hypothetical protein BDQ94DRAFT_144132 [Aspergillus welwitschiae]|uniref:Uncharacterized protein n=1 Tax=Aspergillus welwitschiae TaxID=1341132 RepID=A0A3F3Q1C4_9EURO|nr:hypothetical protein BDQ94DRAFT_144132 [Aspergillus welwitschiae]RDH32895.1 hypothetical protein BDQ94DRAFT_144132 [Aspergillus welwitschiae]
MNPGAIFQTTNLRDHTIPHFDIRKVCVIIFFYASTIVYMMITLHSMLSMKVNA